MNKKILIIVGALVIVLALFFIWKNVSFAPTGEINNEKGPESNLEKIKIDPDVPGMTLPLSNDPKDVAWAVFQKYLAYNKVKDIEGVRSTVYKIAPVCEDLKLRIDCEGRMGAAYAYGSALKKDDFTNVWGDEKQIILSSDFKIQEDDAAIGRNRAIIFFVKDASGDLKMLSFSPFKGAVASKGSAGREELTDRITRYTDDNDEDGVADYDEECLGGTVDQVCAKTNPKIRDTDGDGFWDGVEALMK